MSNNVSPTNRLNVLRVDASMRRSGSVTRELADDLIAVLEARDGGIALVNRDLTEGLPFIDESWIGANVTDPAERSDSQKERLALSDTLVDELKAADVVVIASPIYNFNVPAAMKAWIDLIARALAPWNARPTTGDLGILIAAVEGLTTSPARRAALRRHIWRPVRFRHLMERFTGKATVPASRATLLAQLEATAPEDLIAAVSARVAARKAAGEPGEHTVSAIIRAAFRDFLKETGGTA